VGDKSPVGRGFATKVLSPGGCFPLVSTFLPEMPFLQLQDTLLHERMKQTVMCLEMSCVFGILRGLWYKRRTIRSNEEQ